MRINEIFETVQGEGATIGAPVIFVRTAICNLHCIWCDTYYTWNFGDGVETRWGLPTVKVTDEVHEMTCDEAIQKIKTFTPKRLVFSGGEPTLQQADLVEIMKRLPEYTFEVETNGTLPLSKDFLTHITQINCSPKLENSGNDKRIRFNKDALQIIAGSKKAYFKFVCMSEADLTEIKDIITQIKIDPKTVYLMPQGKTKAEQESLAQSVQDLAIREGYNFSPRLHILMHDTKRGV